MEPTGEPVTVARSGIRALRGRSTDVETKPSADSAKVDAEESSGGVKVHIESNRSDIQLLKVTGTAAYSYSGGAGVAMAFAPVCMAPCDKKVDGSTGQKFFLTVDGQPIGPQFRLHNPQKAETIRLLANVHRKPSVGLRFAGGFLMPFGASALAGSIVWAALGSAEEGGLSNDDQTGAWALGGGGVALLGASIAMFVVGRGSYDVDVPKDAALHLRGLAFTPPIRVGTDLLPASASASFSF